MATDGANDTKLTPVYVPYATLISSLDALRQHGIPNSGVIDKTIWESQAGSVQAQLILGFKFLGLIDEQRKVMPTLPPLVAAIGEERKPLLKKVIEERYRTVISLGLTTISPGQLDEAFRALDVNGSTLARATRFFIKACTELGIPIAKRFAERTRATGPRKKRANGASKNKDESGKADMSPPVDINNPNAHSSAMKTIQLPKVGGVLSITGTFNAFMLMGEERTLVYDIIDLMTAYELKAGQS